MAAVVSNSFAKKSFSKYFLLTGVTKYSPKEDGYLMPISCIESLCDDPANLKRMLGSVYDAEEFYLSTRNALYVHLVQVRTNIPGEKSWVEIYWKPGSCTWDFVTDEFVQEQTKLLIEEYAQQKKADATIHAHMEKQAAARAAEIAAMDSTPKTVEEQKVPEVQPAVQPEVQKKQPMRKATKQQIVKALFDFSLRDIAGCVKLPTLIELIRKGLSHCAKNYHLPPRSNPDNIISLYGFSKMEIILAITLLTEDEAATLVDVEKLHALVSKGHSSPKKVYDHAAASTTTVNGLVLSELSWWLVSKDEDKEPSLSIEDLQKWFSEHPYAPWLLHENNPGYEVMSFNINRNPFRSCEPSFVCVKTHDAQRNKIWVVIDYTGTPEFKIIPDQVAHAILVDLTEQKAVAN